MNLKQRFKLRPRTTGIVVGALCGALASCAMQPGMNGQVNVANWHQNMGSASALIFPSAGSDQSFGAYLAGIHAEAHHDFASAGKLFAEALEEAPDDVTVLSRAFMTAISSGERREAERLAERLVQHATSAGVSRLVLAIRSLRDNRPELIFTPPENADDEEEVGLDILLEPMVVAWAHAALGEHASAVAALDELGDDGAFGFFRDYHAALISVMLNKPEEAEQAFAKALPRGGLSLRSIIAYGRFLAANGRRGDAVTVFDAFLKRSPGNPIVLAERNAILNGETLPPLIGNASEGLAEALYGTASALINDRADRIARIYLRLALFAQPDFPVAQMTLAELFERDGKYESALSVLEGVADKSALKAKARIQAAFIMDEMGRTDEALARLRRLEKMYEADPATREEAIIGRADILRMSERWVHAASAYTEVIESREDLAQSDWPLFYQRGICFERAGQWGRAEADFRKALELQPGQPNVQNYLGYSWVDQGINLEEGRAMIEAAVRQRPLDGHIVDSLGWVLYKLGDYEVAVRVLERAVALIPGDPVVNDHLGDAMWKVGRTREARFQWRHALTMEPEADHAETLMIKIDRGLDAAAGRAAPG